MVGKEKQKVKLVIPPECQIGAHTFQIRYSDKIMEVMGTRGGCEYLEQHIIRLKTNRPASATFQTLLHEATHLITMLYNPELKEEDIWTIGAVLCQFLMSLGIEPDFSQILEEEL